MSDVTRIQVGAHAIGIIGLKAALDEIIERRGTLSDDEIGQWLLERLSRQNYVPDEARAAYNQAFLREFKQHCGAPAPGEPGDRLEIKVLGQGCPRCERLTQDIMAVLTELELPAALEHVRDINEIARYGVLSSPALLIDGQVKATGTVPSKARLKEWLTAAANRSSA